MAKYVSNFRGREGNDDLPTDNLLELSSLTLAAANMLVLFFLFCEGKTEENLEHIFNLFDADGNKVGGLEFGINISIEF